MLPNPIALPPSITAKATTLRAKNTQPTPSSTRKTPSNTASRVTTKASSRNKSDGPMQVGPPPLRTSGQDLLRAIGARREQIRRKRVPMRWCRSQRPAKSATSVISAVFVTRRPSGRTAMLVVCVVDLSRLRAKAAAITRYLDQAPAAESQNHTSATSEPGERQQPRLNDSEKTIQKGEA
jgi:hypothetical protein